MLRNFRTLFVTILLASALHACQLGATPNPVLPDNTSAGTNSGETTKTMTFGASRFTRSAYEPQVEAFNGGVEGM